VFGISIFDFFCRINCLKRKNADVNWLYSELVGLQFSLKKLVDERSGAEAAISKSGSTYSLDHGFKFAPVPHGGTDVNKIIPEYYNVQFLLWNSIGYNF